jgi:hypothetical protein
VEEAMNAQQAEFSAYPGGALPLLLEQQGFCGKLELWYFVINSFMAFSPSCAFGCTATLP